MVGIIGAIVNAAVVILGGIIGVIAGKAFTEKISDTIMKGLGLVVMLIGLSGALEGKLILVTIISIALGALIGDILDIDKFFRKLSEAAERKFAKKDSNNGNKGNFAEGMCAGALLFCVGAMAVVGSLQAGLTGDCTTIYTKSLIDFIAAMILASTMGIGVSFSSIPLFIYQGVITLCAGVISPFLSEAVVAEMTCAGSLIIMGLGLNMIGVAKLKVANYLPAIFLPIAICPIYNIIADLLSKLV